MQVQQKVFCDHLLRPTIFAVVLIINPIIFKKQELSECETQVNEENTIEEATEAAAEVYADIDL